MIVTVIGAGGFADEVALYLRRSFNNATIVNYVHTGYVKDGLKDLHEIKNGYLPFIAIGDPNTKERIVKQLGKMEYRTLVFGFSGSIIGEGSIVCPGTIITTNVEIGRHVIVNINCTVGHDSVIGDFSTLSPGVHVSGNVNIGRRCYVGTGAAIREKINICDDVVIGANAVVVKDITEPGTYVGNPLRKL